MTTRNAHLLALLIVVAGALACLDSSIAATWVVAKDGTGHYTVLFDAVHAAASGDTVYIRAGVYDDLRTFTPSANPVQMVAFARQADLTIIGEHRDLVILGPAAPPAQTPPVIIFGTDLGSGTIRLQGVTVRNSGNDGISANGDHFELRDSRVIGHRQLNMRSTCRISTMVDGVEFADGLDSGCVVFNSQGAQWASVTNSTFRNFGGSGLQLQSRNGIVEGCTFSNNRTGFSAAFPASAVVRNCSFERTEVSAVRVFPSAYVSLQDSYFAADNAQGLHVSGSADATGNEFMGGTFATISFLAPDSGPSLFSGNHILNSGALTIRAQSGIGPIRNFDLTGNYWGTTDVNQISAWILDRNDDPAGQYINIVFQPIADQPIPVEESSIGELKDWFRQEE